MHWKLVLLLPILAANAAEPLFVDAKSEVSGQWKGRETRSLASFDGQPMPKEAFTRFGGLS